MKVLLIGSGGREHALGWAISRSPSCEALYIAPGNAGTKAVGENVALAITDHQAVIGFCAERGIDLVVIGPEAPLVDGLADSLRAANLAVFGPSAQAAQLEGSKGFTKALCDEANIPTAAYGRFAAKDEALAYLARVGAPIVIKADGLAAGKGVTVAMDLETAKAAIEACFDGAFGDAGAEVVIEEFMEGEEASFFALTDGTHVVPFGTAQDHKRAHDGDEGPNTGGMGAYSPASILTPALIETVMENTIRPTVETLKKRGTPYSGVLYAGLMLTSEGPRLVEYNARFGDPEAQVLCARFAGDLLSVLDHCARGTLDQAEIAFEDGPAITVVMAAKGYPGAYEKNTPIGGIDDAEAVEGVKIFHAGTAEKDGRIVANGGRVLNVTAKGASVAEARARAYEAIARISWPEGFCRSDIGYREIAREEA